MNKLNQEHERCRRIHLRDSSERFGDRSLKTGRRQSATIPCATSAVEREFYLDAYRWLTSDDSSWPFSFLNVCHFLNLTPETIREELVGDMSLGVFSYWTRRFERAASKFLSQVFTTEDNSNSAESRTLAHISQ